MTRLVSFPREHVLLKHKTEPSSATFLKRLLCGQEAFLRNLSNLMTTTLKVRSPSEEQLKAPIEFVKHIISSGFEPVDELKRRDTIMNYLGVWAFSNALLFLTYFTHAHESTSRYSLKQRGNIKKGKIGCDDYDESLGIVNRIRKIGYVTSLTLNDMKDEIDSLVLFFAVEHS